MSVPFLPDDSKRIARFRENLAQAGSENGGRGGSGSASLPKFSYRHEFGVEPRFNNTQENKFAVVGANAPEFILVETHDLKDQVWVLKRFILIAPNQVVGILEGLHEADRRLAELDLAPRDQWPAFPLPMSEGSNETSAIKVVLDMYNDRLNVKVTAHGATGNRNGQWLKIDPVDCILVMRYLIQGFDFIAPNSRPQPTPDDDGIPF